MQQINNGYSSKKEAQQRLDYIRMNPVIVKNKSSQKI